MSQFVFYFFEFTAINIILSLGIYPLFRAKQVYFGPMYCMCIGAYFTAFVARDWHWPIVLAIIGAVILCVGFSAIFANKLANLPGFPMLLATTALIFIVQTVIRNMDFLGGSSGFFRIPFVSHEILLPATYICVVLIGILVYRLDHSHIGRAIDAIRFDINFASTLGINAVSLSVKLQLMASALGGLAGGFYALTLGSISPSSFGFSLIVNVTAILVVGGMYTMWGIFIVAPIIFAISQFAPPGFANIIYALLLVITLVARPTGIIDAKTLRSIVRLYQGLKKRQVFLATNKRI